jgi:hypothetical protein
MGHTHKHTKAHRQQGDLISLLSSPQNKESMLQVSSSEGEWDVKENASPHPYTSRSAVIIILLSDWLFRNVSPTLKIETNILWNVRSNFTLDYTATHPRKPYSPYSCALHISLTHLTALHIISSIDIYILSWSYDSSVGIVTGYRVAVEGP